MKQPKRSRIEQETTVTMNQADDHALVWTCSPVHLRKFCRLGCEMIRNDGDGRLYKIPKTAISFRKPLKLVRKLNLDQQKAAGDRLRAFRASKAVS